MKSVLIPTGTMSYGVIPYTNKITFKKQFLVNGYINKECCIDQLSNIIIPIDLINMIFYYYLDYVEIPMDIAQFRGCLDDNREDGPKWLGFCFFVLLLYNNIYIYIYTYIEVIT